jgi:hypothetical protein
MHSQFYLSSGAVSLVLAVFLNRVKCLNYTWCSPVHSLSYTVRTIQWQSFESQQHVPGGTICLGRLSEVCHFRMISRSFRKSGYRQNSTTTNGRYAVPILRELLKHARKCKIWGFHGGAYEECRLLGYKNPVRTSQKTYYISATESSQLILYKILGYHGGDYEECRLLGYKTHVRLEVFTVVTIQNGVFWDITPCGSCKNRRFERT